MASCTQCQRSFDVSESDLAMYSRFDVSIPDLCFYCRLQRRMSFFNRRKLYRRKCDKTGQEIVSIFSPDKPHTVYSKDAWYGDDWDPLDYGRPFDFSRPFFEQYKELLLEVPLFALAVHGQNENSEYVSDVADLKNCYLVFDGAESQDCMYGEGFMLNTDCTDFLSLKGSELCYECSSCQNCYSVRYSQYSKNCSHSWFLRDCVGCKECFGCLDLRQQTHCVFNEKVSPAAYQDFISGFDSGNYEQVQARAKEVQEFFASQPQKEFRGIQNQDCSGDLLNFCKNAQTCYNSENLEDSSYCTDCLMGGKNCMDIHGWGDGLEDSYNCAIVGISSSRLFCCCWTGLGGYNLAYCWVCLTDCQELFGCVGLRKKRYCILNKQYSKEEFEALRPKIVAHMKETGEWGQFFPGWVSPFGYNETLAMEYRPLTREQALEQGWNWCDFDSNPKSDSALPAAELPATIDDVSDELLKRTIQCQESGQLFRFVKKELDYYRQNRVPLPRVHPDVRHLNRVGFKMPYATRAAD